MESIRILQDTYEKLFALTRPIAHFLEEKLPAISSQWKRECVDEIIKAEFPDGSAKYVNRKLEDLDIYYLLKVLLNDKNWKRLSEIEPLNQFYSPLNKEVLIDVAKIRNKVSHPHVTPVTMEDYISWKTTIETAARLFNVNLDILIAELHQEEKSRLLTIIRSKVIEPALKCKELDESTKERIRGTLTRLEVQNTAAGIMYFFEDALRARGGIQIKDTLHAHSLTAFEDIAEEVSNVYYGA